MSISSRDVLHGYGIAPQSPRATNKPSHDCLLEQLDRQLRSGMKPHRVDATEAGGEAVAKAGALRPGLGHRTPRAAAAASASADAPGATAATGAPRAAAATAPDGVSKAARATAATTPPARAASATAAPTPSGSAATSTQGPSSRPSASRLNTEVLDKAADYSRQVAGFGAGSADDLMQPIRDVAEKDLRFQSEMGLIQLATKMNEAAAKTTKTTGESIKGVAG